jgi:oligoendopeptidase F
MADTMIAGVPEVQGPAWDLSDEYPAPDSAEVAADLEALSAVLDTFIEPNAVIVAQIEALPELTPEGAQPVLSGATALYGASEEASRLLGNVLVYANCLLSVDANDEQAHELQGRLQGYQKRYAQLAEPLSQFVELASDAVIDRYLENPAVADCAFQVRHARKRRHEHLSLNEENLISGLSQDGIHAWGRLYSQLSSTLSCEVLVGNEPQTMGIAQANGLLQKPEERLRRAAWQGINNAWETQEESCAAAINAIAGWRLELNSKRSTQQDVHFLDAPMHMNRIGRGTLDALLEACEEKAPLARRAALAMARATGRERLGPWDMRAPAPVLSGAAEVIEFEDAVQLIADAYAQVDPAMGEFVNMMVARRWIEGTVSSHKRPGAYCTGFAKSRHPRVYMTYTGSSSDVITLAHELGHAFHSWVMRDLPDSQRSYGMSLAETASTFGETTVRDALFHRAADAAGQFDILWEEVSALPSFMLNIPARYSFEKAFYQRRAERPLRPTELKTLMSDAWTQWYADSISEPDPMFWASKLHFYISGLSFYNFPYLFGYLFSMGVYLRRDAMGDEFYPRYVALLRDTGRMTAEQLATTHLDVRLDDAEFWRATIDALEPKVARFEALVDELVG